MFHVPLRRVYFVAVESIWLWLFSVQMLRYPYRFFLSICLTYGSILQQFASAYLLPVLLSTSVLCMLYTLYISIAALHGQCSSLFTYILKLSLALHSFLQFYLSAWDHFPLVQRTSFNICYSVSPLEKNSLSSLNLKTFQFHF